MDARDVTRHRGEGFRVLEQTDQSDRGDDDLARRGRWGRKRRIARIRSSISSRVMIPSGARHHVRNPGRAPLFFVTIYAPPEY